MSKPSSPISENPTSQELLERMQGAKLFSRNNEEVSGLSEKMLELVHLPDRFNKHFADRGWIAHESLNVDLAKKAIGLADTGKLDEAEQLLMNYYDEGALDFIVQRCKHADAFRPRWELAQAAKADYLQGRFYSAVPLILILIDGFVNDIEQTGFFAEKTDLTAWDSIAAHNSGLTKLAEIFNRSRKKTTSEQLSLPYRHGILHGRDLGYANKMVAAKGWAALAAIAEWALHLRDGKKHPKPQAAIPSLNEMLCKLQEIEECKKNTAAWKPREISVGITIPESGIPTDYADGSPEQALACLFNFWKEKNYGKMALLLCDFSWRVSIKRAGEIRANFGPVEFDGFKILEVKDDVPAITIIRAVVNYAKHGRQTETEISLRLSYQSENGEPRVYPFEKASWVILEAGFNKMVYGRA
jgi:hypothetical protein